METPRRPDEPQDTEAVDEPIALEDIRFEMKDDNLDGDCYGVDSCDLCRRIDHHSLIPELHCMVEKVVYRISYNDKHDFIGISRGPLRYELKSLYRAIYSRQGEEEKLIQFYQTHDFMATKIDILCRNKSPEEMFDVANVCMKIKKTVESGLNMSLFPAEPKTISSPYSYSTLVEVAGHLALTLNSTTLSLSDAISIVLTLNPATKVPSKLPRQVPSQRSPSQQQLSEAAGPEPERPSSTRRLSKSVSPRATTPVATTPSETGPEEQQKSPTPVDTPPASAAVAKVTRSSAK